MKRLLSVHRCSWPLIMPFRITGYEYKTVETIVVEIEEDGFIGRGEGLGVYYLGESADTILEQVEAARGLIQDGVTIEALSTHMPAGGARNAVDCALWDLECKQSNQSIWKLVGIDPKPVTTVFTIGIEATASEMAEKARAAQAYSHLKIKLDANDPVGRLSAIRDARPDAAIVVDANQGFSIAQLSEVLPRFAELGVLMLEQPLPRGQDFELEGLNSPIPLCADESCLHLGELEKVISLYDVINIKLDKTGGLTEALSLAREVLRQGKRLMVGNMLGTSLSMAPAFVIAQLCEFVDLDGPLNLKSDYLGGMNYNKSEASLPKHEFWGA